MVAETLLEGSGEPEELEGRPVLVTGADGFIGSHLVERLVGIGASVRAFCFYNSSSSLGWLDHAAAEVRDAIDVRLGDVRDARFVENACDGMDVVFHLASLVSIPYSYTAPESFVDTNVRGTLNVLEGARRRRCTRLVHTSTSEVYGTPETIPITEDHSLKGQSPYSASKIAADKMAEAYVRSFDVPVVVLRPFNTYGPRQSARAVIPTVLSQIIAGRTRVQLGSLRPRRDFTFIDDTVEGFIRAAVASGVEGETVHLGTGVSYSIQQVVDMAATLLAAEITVEATAERVRPAASEVEVLQSDRTKAKRLLGWSPSIAFEEGLRRTAEWIADHQSYFDPDTYRA